ncbi:13537_t:CDS:1, partial [Racocetra persica]
SEIEMLNKKVEDLESELDLYKILVPVSCNWCLNILCTVIQSRPKSWGQMKNSPKLNSPKTQQPKKRCKTMPFAQLLTNNESLCLLREAEEEAERTANEKRQKKEMAT